MDVISPFNRKFFHVTRWPLEVAIKCDSGGEIKRSGCDGRQKAGGEERKFVCVKRVGHIRDRESAHVITATRLAAAAIDEQREALVVAPQRRLKATRSVLADEQKSKRTPPVNITKLFLQLSLQPRKHDLVCWMRPFCL